jgi:hypothetical protein
MNINPSWLYLAVGWIALESQGETFRERLAFISFSSLLLEEYNN